MWWHLILRRQISDKFIFSWTILKMVASSLMKSLKIPSLSEPVILSVNLPQLQQVWRTPWGNIRSRVKKPRGLLLHVPDTQY